MQVMRDRQSDAMLLISASDLRTFANVLIQETGDSVAEKTFSAVKAAMGDKIKYCTRGEASENFRSVLSDIASVGERKVSNPSKNRTKSAIFA